MPFPASLRYYIWVSQRGTCVNPLWALHGIISLRIRSAPQNFAAKKGELHLWIKPLAKRNVNASFRLAFNLRFVWRPTCVDVRWLWSSRYIWTQVDARFHCFATQRKLIASWSQVICICVKVLTFCDLRELASRLTNPFGHPSQVRTQVLVLQTCVDLRVRLARAL